METAPLCINLFFWILGFLFLYRIPTCRRSGSRDARPPSVSIIIPARNEAENLPRLLGSITTQTLTPGEIIVVDDHSEDGTAAVAQQAGAHVIAARPLPDGWVGKTWACHQGAEAAAGEILLFLDADTALEPDGLVRILDTAVRHGGVVSVQPYHRMKRISEEVSAFFNIIQMGATTAFTILGGRIPKTGMFGPSLIVDRNDYARVGGHEIVKGQILEDYFLARRFRREGIPIHCFGGRGAIAFRMYPRGLMEAARGWSKAFAAGARRTSLPALLAIVLWISGSVDVTRHVIEALAAGPASAAAPWFGLYVAFAGQIYWMLRRIGNFGWYTALLFPLPLAFFCIVFMWSCILLVTGRPVTWKQRAVKTRRSG
jgi:4,4'-diaponeurosporenoate glycosyltransferase